MKGKCICSFQNPEYLGNLVSEAIKENEVKIDGIDRILIECQNADERRSLIHRREELELSNYSSISRLLIEKMQNTLQPGLIICV